MLEKLKKLIYPSLPEARLLKPQLDSYLTAMLIGKAIREKTPFLASRIGFTEARCLAGAKHSSCPSQYILDIIWRYSGVFPATAEQFNEFAVTYKNALKEVDLLGLIKTLAEAELAAICRPEMATCELGSLEPYLHECSWSRYLEGLRVVVIHPFVETIRRQYSENREQLFIKKDILPVFDLLLVKAPQTLAGNTAGYTSWSDAYRRTCDQIQQLQFDVAILGCGAYGLPLGACVKTMGRVAIHLGGATQLMFGISGKRWLSNPAFRALMTSAWCRPSQNEMPSGAEKVEEGCYW